MKTCGSWRSCCSHRERIAPGLRGLAWENLQRHLFKREQHAPGDRGRRPAGAVPGPVWADDPPLARLTGIEVSALAQPAVDTVRPETKPMPTEGAAT